MLCVFLFLVLAVVVRGFFLFLFWSSLFVFVRYYVAGYISFKRLFIIRVSFDMYPLSRLSFLQSCNRAIVQSCLAMPIQQHKALTPLLIFLRQHEVFCFVCTMLKVVLDTRCLFNSWFRYTIPLEMLSG